MSFLAPLRNTYRYLQSQAHEQPVIFFSVALGLVGPLAVVVVPEVRKSFGWKPVSRPPTTYPLPSRARDTSLEGYDDGWKPATA